MSDENQFTIISAVNRLRSSAVSFKYQMPLITEVICMQCDIHYSEHTIWDGAISVVKNNCS